MLLTLGFQDVLQTGAWPPRNSAAALMLHTWVILITQVDKHLADAVLVLPPFYFSHVSEGGLEHFLQSILEEAELPVYLYNFPVHTNNMFSVDTYKVVCCWHAAMRKPVCG